MSDQREILARRDRACRRRRSGASRAALDDERRWMVPLTSTGPEHDQAVRELHGLLLRASAHEVRRRAAALGISQDSELGDIAHQAADDALLAVMARLDRLRAPQPLHDLGLQVRDPHGGVAVRRHAWRDPRACRESAETLARLATSPR